MLCNLVLLILLSQNYLQCSFQSVAKYKFSGPQAIGAIGRFAVTVEINIMNKAATFNQIAVGAGWIMVIVNLISEFHIFFIFPDLLQALFIQITKTVLF